jgi:hypothetical protein
MSADTDVSRAAATRLTRLSSARGKRSVMFGLPTKTSVGKRGRGDRREALKSLLLICQPGLAAGGRVPEDMGMSNSLENLTVEAFQSRIGESFHIRPRPDTDVGAELIEARALGAGRVSGTPRRRVPFSLSFRTATTGVLPQRIYEVVHDEMGAYEIFLVPVGPDGKGMVYEAIFT